MSNVAEVKIPYSAEAVNNLLLIEREHVSCYYPNQPKGYTGECRGCYWDPVLSSKNTYPCPILLEARALSSLETKVAVVLISGS